ncbi:hypothetical protein [Nocardioides ungokensis]|uniref:hypothetical protein n=1 Tax=Nocardioides ungokensis TaxID=1643322 RepID=UPI0015E00208|nr:hypothetical protein [Nocardioides ungokensis]
MQLSVNGHTVDVDPSDKVRLHLPGTDWVVTYFGHRQSDMDLVLDQRPEEG